MEAKNRAVPGLYLLDLLSSFSRKHRDEIRQGNLMHHLVRQSLQERSGPGHILAQAREGTYHVRTDHEAGWKACN